MFQSSHTNNNNNDEKYASLKINKEPEIKI